MIKWAIFLAALLIGAGCQDREQQAPKRRESVPLQDRVKLGSTIDLGNGVQIASLVIGHERMPDIESLNTVCYVYSESQTGFKQVFCPPE